MFLVVFITVLLFLGSNAQVDEETFPDDFLLGFATASYQIEGAWNEDGKGENIWDRMTHAYPEAIKDGSNGDIADDSYHKYKEDVQLLKGLNAQVYRFSISWTRILPKGDDAIINQAGIDYYNNLINELLDNGIQPMVTMYHWDLPQPLQDLGGWANPYISDYYADYARVLFYNFGDRVKWWITFNEPLQICHAGYGGAAAAPQLNMPGIAEYFCAHTLIQSHAKAYHIYDDEFRSTQRGQIGITLDGGWYEPLTDAPEDIQAAEKNMQFAVGWYAHPIFLGDYPPIMRKMIDENSVIEGRPRSRLPVFTPEEVDFINETADFLGINHYSTNYATPTEVPWTPSPSWNTDLAVDNSKDPYWPESASDWLKVVPWGIRNHVNWVKNEYGDIPMFITENGYSDTPGLLQDDNRINYYNNYLHNLLQAIYEDECNILGYIAWSLMDNFEWTAGYSERFGIYSVDYDDPDRPRIPKASAQFFKDIYSARKLPPLDSTLRSEEYLTLFEGFDFSLKKR